MEQTTRKRLSTPSYVLKDFDKAAETALFYGFTPVKTPQLEKKDHAAGNALLEQKKLAPFPHELYPHPAEKASLLRTYTEWNLHTSGQPAMLYYRRPFGGSQMRRSSAELHAELDIIGTHSSIADAIAIKTACAILQDYGFTNLAIDINSLGDRESMGRFDRELNSFLRKQNSVLPQELRQQFRQDPFELFRCTHECMNAIRHHVPQPVGCLSEQSSAHFKEVLEYLEAGNTPYRINHALAPERQYCSHTIFEIKHIDFNEAEPDKSQETVVAFGTRHNHIAKRIGFKKELPFVSVNIGFKKRGTDPKPVFKAFKPKFYFIQFGSFAKMKSLALIETLRQARIPVYHSLTKDKFVGQLSAAETIDTPFIIIMGQKEALENSVVVRHMGTRAQETVPVQKLTSYLAKLR